MFHLSDELTSLDFVCGAMRKRLLVAVVQEIGFCWIRFCHLAGQRRYDPMTD